MDDQRIAIAALQKVPFFAGLTRQDLQGILFIGQQVSFEPGQVMVERGEPGDGMYIITSGAAQVDAAGRSIDLESGDFFGEMAVLARRERTATVRAVAPVEALKIPARAFRSFLLEYPRVGITMLESMVERLREVQERIDAQAGAW